MKKLLVTITGALILLTVSLSLFSCTDAVEECLHANKNTVKENEVAPGCAVDGSYDEVTYCKDCNTELSREVKSVPALGHEVIIYPEKNPSCTEAGYTAHEKCAKCDEMTEHEEFPALGHEIISYDGLEPTCTRSGFDAYVLCSRCGYSTYNERPALGHTEVTDKGFEPNCTDAGKTDGKHCSVCNEVLTAQEIIPALGHDYENNVCTVCGAKSTSASVGLEFFDMDDGTCFVSGIGTCTDTDIVIPSVSPDGKAVVGIYAEAFSGQSSLTSISIPASITTVAGYPFTGCTGLEAVYIESLAAWCDISFADVGANPLRYAEKLYLNGELITELVIPDTVTSIGNYAFSNCTSLVSVTVGDGVTKIGSGAFKNCTGLTEAVISGGVERISYYLFEGCTNLVSVKISEGVKVIDYYAFRGCSNLVSIELPSTLTQIDYAFEGCRKLFEVINHSSFEITVGSYDHGSVAYIAKVVHNGESLVNIVDGYIFVTLDGVNYLLGHKGSFSELILPESYNGESYEIYDYAFYGYTELKKLVISGGATAIGSYAFSECTALSDVVIYGAENIGSYAFFGCSGLKDLKIGEGVISIGEHAFQSCRGLSILVIPDSVTSIGGYAFAYCSGLVSVTVGKGVVNMVNYAFSDCKRLIEVINKSSLNITAGSWSCGYVAYNAKIVHTGDSLIKEVGDYHFITGKDGVNYLFKYVGDDTELTLPESYNGEGYVVFDYTFSGRTEITSLVIPNGVTKIGQYAFDGCNRLVRVEIGENVKDIGSMAFSGCVRLVEVINKSQLKITEGSDQYGYVGMYALAIHTGDSLIKKSGDYLFITVGGVNYLFGYTGDDTDITLPESYNGESYVINEYAFDKLDKIRSITVSGGIEAVGRSAFSDCTALEGVYIDDLREWCGISFEDYESNPLRYAGNLYLNGELVTELVIPDGVKSIGTYVFSGCTSVVSVVIPDSVEFIGDDAFGFRNVRYNEYANANYLGNENNPYLVLVSVINKSADSIDIHKDTKFIYSSALFYCYNLTDVEIPDGVKGIGRAAFGSCDRLVSIEIPNSVTYIGNSAFSGCDKLERVKIGDGVEYIDYATFTDCYALRSVTFGRNVKVIGNSAFYLCKALSEIDLPEGLTAIGDSAFYKCEGLTRLVIPDSVTEIGSSAFYECNNITSIILGKSVNTIGGKAFYGCAGIITVEIPAGVTSIGNNAFQNCYRLVEVINKSSLDIKKGYSDKTQITSYAKIVHKGEDGIKNVDGFLFVTADGVNYLVGYAGNETHLKLPEYYNGETYMINQYAFYSVKGILSIEFSDTVTVINRCAFSNCVDLMSVTLGSGLQSIQDSAFFNCNKLIEVINKSQLNITFGSAGDGYVGAYAKIIHTGETVIKNVGNYLFATIDGVHYLVGYTGEDTELTLPENYNGESYEIMQFAFAENAEITSVVIPVSVKIIGAAAFEGCKSLKDVYYTGTEEEWNAISIGWRNDPLTNATKHYEYQVDN